MDPEPHEETPLHPVEKPKPPTTDSEWGKLSEAYKLIGSGPREFYLTLLITLLISFSFFIISLMTVLHLTEDHGLSDLEAGIVYAGLGFVTTASSLLEGSLPDKLGTRICLIIGTVVAATGTLSIALCTNTGVIIFFLLTLIPIGSGMGIPVAKVATKHYTLPEARSVAYSLLFVTIHAGGAFASLFVDLMTNSSNLDSGFGIYQWILLIAGLVQLLIIPLALLLRDFDYEESLNGSIQPYGEFDTYISLVKRVFSQYQFRILLIYVLLQILAKAVYRQLDAAFPKYMKREMGDDVHFGLVMVAHPIFLVLSAVGFTPLVYCFSLYNIIILGTLVCCFGCFVLLAGTSYLTCVIFVILVSIGEGIWTPRLYDYTLALAPKGMEGTFMALATVPTFLSMVVAGGISGLLLSTLCTEEDTEHCGLMWVCIALVGLISPVCSVIFRRWLEIDPRYLDIPRK